MALTEDQQLALAGFNADAADDVKILAGAAVDAATSGICEPSTEMTLAFLLPDAATSTYSYTVPEKLEIVGVTIIKDGAGAANTIQVKNGAGTAISDAIAAAVDKAVTRAATLDKATRVLAAAATLQITNTRAAGTSAAAVFVRCLRRA